MGERSGRARSWAIRGSAGMLVATSLTALVGAPVGAQTPVPPTPATPATTPATAAPESATGDGEWHNGEAAASADTFLVNIKQGNANIGVTYGRSLAGYRDITGNAEARAIDLGVLPTLFGGEQCDGSAPIMNPATFPPNTRTDSLAADSATSRRTEAFNPGLGTEPHGTSAGWQDATATKTPSARGITETPPSDMFVIAIDGGRSETTASLEGRVRSARAVVTADRLRVFGGLFTFENPRWEAIATSGEQNSTRGNFTFESATVLGMPRNVDQALADLAAFEAGLEELLAPFGVQLNLPRVEVADGRVKVTPMEFLVKDMPWGANVIAPFLGQVQPYKEALTKQLLAEDCKNESSLILLDVILGILGGSGAIEVMAGGVEASTAATDFSAPPLEPLPTNSSQPPPDTTPVEAATEVMPMSDFSSDFGFDDFSTDDLGFDDFDDLGLDDGLGTIDTLTTTPTVADDTEEVAAVPAVAGTRFEDSAAGAAAVAVGIAGLLGAIGLSFGERIMSRRTSRRIP